MAVDAYTKLLLHCDGADGSTTFTDNGANTKVVTAVGNAQVDTAIKKFGTGGLLLDGTGDWLTVPDDDDWNFGTGDLTIDFWIYPTADQIFDFCGQGSGTTFIRFWWEQTEHHIKFGYLNAGTWDILFDCDYDFAGGLNAWHHMAVVRNGNTWYLFVDGTSYTLALEAGAYTASLGDIVTVFYIGAGDGGDGPVLGSMDEFRISKGIARWTANFTPPTAAYEGSSASPSPSPSPSVSVSLSKSPSPSVSVSLSPSVSPSASESASPSVFESPSLSPSVSPSASPSISPSASPSFSPSLSPSASISPSASPSVSISLSPSLSPSISVSLSPSVSISPSPSLAIYVDKYTKQNNTYIDKYRHF